MCVSCLSYFDQPPTFSHPFWKTCRPCQQFFPSEQGDAILESMLECQSALVLRARSRLKRICLSTLTQRGERDVVWFLMLHLNAVVEPTTFGAHRYSSSLDRKPPASPPEDAESKASAFDLAMSMMLRPYNCMPVRSM